MAITTEEIRIQIIQAINYSGVKKIEIAKKLGIKQPTLSQYLSGRAMPSLETFANLCKILDLDANEILCINRKTHKLNVTNSFNNFSGSGNNIKF